MKYDFGGESEDKKTKSQVDFLLYEWFHSAVQGIYRRHLVYLCWNVSVTFLYYCCCSSLVIAEMKCQSSSVIVTTVRLHNFAKS